MKKIEAELGVPLFTRTKSKIALNDTGKIAAKYAEKVLEADCKMVISAEITSDDNLIAGLKNHLYQLIILHQKPEDNDIFCHKFIDEQLAITLPSDHCLAKKETIPFQDLNGIRILAHGGSGFWIDICKENLKESKLLVQDNMDTLSKLVNASSLPVFNSNRAMKAQDNANGRVTIPISDDSAYITYYLSCLNSEKEKYAVIFNAI